MFTINREVSTALSTGRPVVALESTLISHGLPWPRNIEVAHLLERTVREEGAVPATIGVVQGCITVGLTAQQIEHLARGQDVRKVSMRDLAIVTALRLDGATTVAATAWAAHRAGIRVFATGGIGGVHRGQPLDISADLPILAQTPVMVVSAGAKSLLDLPLTLEWLETHGVPVLGYGTDEFPAFYSRHSGLKVDCRVDSPEEVAEVFKTKLELGVEGGLLITVPIPEDAELPSAEVEAAIGEALAAAGERGVTGNQMTPFVLAYLHERTGARTLEANVALLRNNATIGARIAVSMTTH